jgi:hypothetical protein
MSILAVGRTIRSYDTSIYVERNPLIFTLMPGPADYRFHETVQDVAIELAGSDSVMAAVANALRVRGITTVDGRDVTGETIREHVSLRASKDFCEIAASSRNAGVSEAIVLAYYNAWFDTLPALVPAVKQKYIGRAQLEFSGSDLDDFLSSWQRMESRGLFAAGARTERWSYASCYGFGLVGDKDKPCCTAQRYPIWKPCLIAAVGWLAIGMVVFAIGIWQRIRAAGEFRDAKSRATMLMSGIAN